jgi:hypothetical protein
MKASAIVMVLAIALLFACDQDPLNPSGEKAWEKTVTLPSGDVILDISGEWDAREKYYGSLITNQDHVSVSKITQEGTKFSGVEKISNENPARSLPKGAETIRGELDKDGFKEVYLYMWDKDVNIWNPTWVWEPCSWEISKDGLTVFFDCGERAKVTLTRR